MRVLRGCGVLAVVISAVIYSASTFGCWRCVNEPTHWASVIEGATNCWITCDWGCYCMTGGQCSIDPPYPDEVCFQQIQADSVWLAEEDVVAAEKALPLLGGLLRSGGGDRHRLLIDSNLEGMATGPDGRELLFKFRGETARTDDGIWFYFEFDGHPEVASLEGELTPSSPEREPQGFVQVTPVEDPEKRERRAKILK